MINSIEIVEGKDNNSRSWEEIATEMQLSRRNQGNLIETKYLLPKNNL